ncbi:dynein light chain 2, cytoplasmic-like [Physella acuta]|uniref:dynein light chain 2, cytoplasmic-like n=1 Tax=Physella acuta TaxID=109671 RepID=UPI0027DD6D46|nr:dynein light chain 2, cytoplasmic-like [Physella acuta]
MAPTKRTSRGVISMQQAAAALNPDILSSMENAATIIAETRRKADPEVNKSSMDAVMVTEAIRVVTEVLGRSREEAAETIKSFDDDKYGPSWQCVVGTAYDVALSHENSLFIPLIINKTGATIWRSGMII